MDTRLFKRFMELSYPVTYVRGNESSIGGTFVLGNFQPLELSFPKAKLAWNFCSLTLIITGPLILT